MLSLPARRLLVIVNLVVALGVVIPAGADDRKTLAAREGRVNLGAKRTCVTISLGKQQRAELRAAAADPARHVMLRIEGIGVSAPPDVVYEIHAGDVSGQPAGMLSFYGIEGEQNGKGIVEVEMGKVLAVLLERESKVHLTFVPKSAEAVAHPKGRAWFRRMRIVAD
jgi:hypothetical protein